MWSNVRYSRKFAVLCRLCLVPKVNHGWYLICSSSTSISSTRSLNVRVWVLSLTRSSIVSISSPLTYSQVITTYLKFGLGTACFFQKAPLTTGKALEGYGLRAIVYIDDEICPACSRSRCLENRDLVTTDLTKDGFVLDITKS